MPYNSHGLIFYTCSTNLGVLLNNWHTLKTAARVMVFFLFLYFILSYEFKITNSVKVQCRNRGHQIDSNGEKSRALALISSDIADKPSLSFHEVTPGLPGCVLFPLNAQFFTMLIPWCTEVSLSLDYGSQAYIVSQKGKLITPYKHNSSISTTKIFHISTCL